MNRTLALTLPVALAACFGLLGCTIYTYPAQPAKTQPHKPGKGKPAPATTGKQTGTVRWPKGSGTAKPGEPAFETPTVTSQTLFGGPTVKGFVGDAYVVPEGTTKLPVFTDLVAFARLYTDKFDIAPQAFSGGFPGALQQDEWFAIQYNGKILIPTEGKWVFTLNADDGAALYIDNQKVIDNDGVHTAKAVTGQVELGSGTHNLRLEYFQEKKGNVALQLTVNLAGKEVPVVAAP